MEIFLLTGSEGAGIRAKAGMGGVPPLKAFVCVRVVTIDRRRRGTKARVAMVTIQSKVLADDIPSSRIAERETLQSRAPLGTPHTS